MRKIPRRLLVFIGAIAIAGGGMAFMAANSVAASNAGEGSAAVIGYNVSNISYGTACTVYPIGDPYAGTTPCLDQDYYTDSTNAAAEGVEFTLTVLAGGVTSQPTNVIAYPEASDGSHPWGHSDNCHLSGTWNAGTGTGSYTCQFDPEVPVSSLSYLDVEANT